MISRRSSSSISWCLSIRCIRFISNILLNSIIRNCSKSPSFIQLASSDIILHFRGLTIARITSITAHSIPRNSPTPMTTTRSYDSSSSYSYGAGSACSLVPLLLWPWWGEKRVMREYVCEHVIWFCGYFWFYLRKGAWVASWLANNSIVTNERVDFKWIWNICFLLISQIIYQITQAVKIIHFNFMKRKISIIIWDIMVNYPFNHSFQPMLSSESLLFFTARKHMVTVE